jgi:hypothetical protein
MEMVNVGRSTYRAGRWYEGTSRRRVRWTLPQPPRRYVAHPPSHWPSREGAPACISLLMSMHSDKSGSTHHPIESLVDEI